jgi:hypothetical protein
MLPLKIIIAPLISIYLGIFALVTIIIKLQYDYDSEQCKDFISYIMCYNIVNLMIFIVFITAYITPIIMKQCPIGENLTYETIINYYANILNYLLITGLVFAQFPNIYYTFGEYSKIDICHTYIISVNYKLWDCYLVQLYTCIINICIIILLIIYLLYKLCKINNYVKLNNVDQK